MDGLKFNTPPSMLPTQHQSSAQAYNRLWYFLSDQPISGRFTEKTAQIVHDTGDRAIVVAFELLKLHGKDARLHCPDGHVEDVFSEIARAKIPQWVREKHNRPTPSLADEAFSKVGKTAVMVASFSHFSGAYPPSPFHTCGAHAQLQHVAADKTKVTRWTPKLWRDRDMGAFTAKACPACYHDRVYRFCRQIEEESLQFADGHLGLRIKRFEDAQHFRKFAGRVRQWRKRDDENGRFIAFPQQLGDYVVIHDVPEREGGEQLPTARPELYDLVASIANTPKGVRVSSVGGWGGNYAKTRGDSKQEEPETAVSGDGQQGETDPKPTPEEIKVVVKNRALLQAMLEGVYGIHKRKGVIDVGIGELCHMMDAAGILYAVTSGKEELNKLKNQNVTDKVQSSDSTKNTLYFKRDKPPKEPEPVPIWEGLFNG